MRYSLLVLASVLSISVGGIAHADVNPLVGKSVLFQTPLYLCDTKQQVDEIATAWAGGTIEDGRTVFHRYQAVKDPAGEPTCNVEHVGGLVLQVEVLKPLTYDDVTYDAYAISLVNSRGVGGWVLYLGAVYKAEKTNAQCNPNERGCI